MNPKRHLGAVLAALLGIAAMTGTADVAAQGKGKGKTAQAAPAADPPMTKNPVVLTPAGLAWGISHKQLGDLYDKVLDQAYKPLYKKVSPGVKMKALDAALAEEKSTFRRSQVDFALLPTGIDATPLRGEYSYRNGESMMSITRSGETRYFFFIKNRLWKVIEEHKLGEKSAYGADFQSAAVALAKTFGVPGRVLPADPAAGRNDPIVDWKDATTHVRAIQRGDDAFAIVYEESSTLANLASLRPNKPANEDEIDPAVAAAIRGGDDEESGPPKKK